MSEKDYIVDHDGNPLGCRLCGADAYWDANHENFIFTCPCGEIDLDELGEE